MKRMVYALLIVMLLIVGCQPGTPPAPETADEPVEEAPEEPVEATEEAAPAEPVEDSSPVEEPLNLELVVTGPEEIVFDWTTDRCEDMNIPDIAPRAIRDADGMVQLTIGHDRTYRMIGPDLNSVEPDCSGPVHTSDLDPDPAMFNDGEWIGSLYTEDGQTIYAVVHNEYRGHMHPVERPGQCPSGDYLTCLDTSLTMAISTDGGVTYRDLAPAPNHLIASMPYPFNDQGVPSGLRQPSNIFKAQDGYFYVFSNISDYPETPGEFPPQWTCLMRTDNLDDPASWRYWDGSDFNGQFLNPYVDAVGPDSPKCAPLDFDAISGAMTDSVTYNSVLDKYVLVGLAYHPSAQEPMWGIYYSLSDDLIDWSQRRLLLEVPLIASVTDPESELIYAYPVLLDPGSPSLNFDTTDETAYIYVSRFNFGSGSLDRDLVRYPIELAPFTYEAPQWTFDTDGDTEGWGFEYQIENMNVAGGRLTLQTSGDDPYMFSGPVEFPASDYSQMNITMKVACCGQTSAQLFFVTDSDAAWDEDKSLVFNVFSDDEFHTYELDLSKVDGWAGIITQLRLDPVWSEGRTIEIDSIEVVE